MLDFLLLSSEDNTTLLTNDTLQKTVDAPAVHPGDYASTTEQDSTPYLNRGTVFFFITALTVIAVGLVLVLKFVRYYTDNRRAAREDQLRTVTWMEGECEEDEVQALVAE